MRERISYYRLDMTACIAGAVVMIVEISASRVLAPYTGLSLYVWTSIIGIILAAMSIGYWLGGTYADRYPTPKGLQKILYRAGCAIALTALLKDTVAAYSTIFFGATTGAIVSSVILFFPPGVFLAMVSPYALRLRLSSIESGGEASGNISALSTIGSIGGTFLAGFVLIPHLATTHILVTVAIITVCTSFFFGTLPIKKLLVFCVLLLCVELWSQALTQSPHTVARIPSAYAFITIKKQLIDGHPAYIVFRDSEAHAGKFEGTSTPVFPIYQAFSALSSFFSSHPERALLLGGGIYDVAERFLNRYPSSTMDAVEIDPKMTHIAKTYFNLPPSDRLRITHQDARVFLNKAKDDHVYDIIFNDSFASFYSVPFQLTTTEAILHMRRLLKNNGIVVSNIVSGLDGDQALFLEAEYKTFQSIFPYVRVFAIDDPHKKQSAQNFLLIASPVPIEPKEKNAIADSIIQKEVYISPSTSTPILSDEFAPVDYFVSLLKLPGRN